MATGVKTCQKCLKTIDEKNFYKRRDGTYMDLCKSCLTLHVDNFEPDTYLWILQEMDFPYIEVEWNNIREKAYAKNHNLTGISVLGKYLSKMRIKQFKTYGWADSEAIKAKNEKEAENARILKEQHEAIIKGQYENGEITEAQYRTLIGADKLHEEDALTDVENPPEVDNPYADGSSYMDDSAIKSLGDNLTDEDKTYLLMKWGKWYQPWEWVELEKKYNEMMASFDIQDADTINTLILICKTNLKMNQALDSADIEGYQKLSRVFNDLRKSAKFTAAQNKEQNSDFVNSVGELVAYCEKSGGIIPKYEITTPQDIVDIVIQDLKNYTRDLIYEDKSLAKQIEDYLKKLEIAKQMKLDQEEAKAAGLEAVEIKDQDLVKYAEYLQKQKEIDAGLESEE